MLTFWRPEDIPQDDSMRVKVEPLGRTTEVVNGLLSIPNSCPYLSSRMLDGYVSVLWKVGNGLVVEFKSEPEFGKDRVYSLLVDRCMVTDMDFFRYYVILSERFGVTLLDDDQGFVTVVEYKGRL